jgi:glucokinase
VGRRDVSANWRVMVAAPPVVIGLDFGGTKIAAAVCDLAGNQLASVTLDSGGALGAQASFGRGIQACHDLLGPTTGRELVAVGVSTFGIPFQDRVELAPAIDGWDRLAMGRELRAAFPGAQIRMANDAKAAARAEVRWGVLAGCDPAVYLNLGTGLAAALVVGGEVVPGVNGAAGEIGYNLRSITDVGRALDQRALLEHMVSGQALGERAAGPDRRGRQLTAAEVFAAGTADSELDGLIDDFVAELAFHLVNLAILVNPARIAVGGGIVRSWARIRPPLQRALHSGTPFPPELVVAHFPYDAPLLGAVAMAVDAAQDRAEPGDAASHDGRPARGDGDAAVVARTGPDGEDPVHRSTINTGTLS